MPDAACDTAFGTPRPTQQPSHVLHMKLDSLWQRRRHWMRLLAQLGLVQSVALMSLRLVSWTSNVANPQAY